jgi:NitT/TauT family transport system substrate-binding protein
MTARSIAAHWLVVSAVLLAACAGSPAPAGSGTAPAGGSPAATGSGVAPAGSGAAPSAPTAPRPETVKATNAPNLGLAPIFVAIERGYFAQEGISFEDPGLDTASSANFFPALATNQLDVAGGGITSAFFNAINQGVVVRIALDMTSAPPGDLSNGLIVRKALVDGGRVHEVADLRGLRAAFTAKGHSTELFLDKALSLGGLSVDDVQTTPLSYQDMAIALGNNNLDVGVMVEPFAALAIMNGAAVRLKSWSEVIPNDQIAVIYMAPAFASDRTEVAQRYGKAYVRGLRDYLDAGEKGTNREEMIAILQKHTGLADRALFDIMPWGAYHPDGRVNLAAVAAAQSWFVSHGYVPRAIDLSTVIDDRFSEYAVAQLGPYERQ